MAVIIQMNFTSYGQTVFDDCEIYTKWTEAIIVLKSRDTIAAVAKYNPLVNSNKIEIKKDEDFYSISTEDVNELSYFDNNINGPRRFKNIEIYFVDLQKKANAFSEVFFDDKYFAITRSISYYGFPSLLNPLGKPSHQLALFYINKTTGMPFKDLSKKTFMENMSDKKLEVEEYMKRNRLKVHGLDHQIKIFEYYARIKD